MNKFLKLEANDFLVGWLDEKYLVKIKQNKKDIYLGNLMIIDNNENLLFNEEIKLSYGARFGLDISDFILFQKLAIDFIDKFNENIPILKYIEYKIIESKFSKQFMVSKIMVFENIKNDKIEILGKFATKKEAEDYIKKII